MNEQNRDATNYEEAAAKKQATKLAAIREALTSCGMPPRRVEEIAAEAEAWSKL